MIDAQKFPIVESCNPSVCISGKMARCNRIVSSVFRKHLKPYGITNSQLSTLFIITKTETATQKSLSSKLYMDKSTVNRNLKRLLEHNYITKENIHVLQTTTKGMTLLETVIPHWENAMTEIRSLLEDEGELALSMLLQRLT